MTVKTLITTISAIDDIAIHNGKGEVEFSGLCQDFRATTKREDLSRILKYKVGRIRAYENVIIILCE